MATASKMHKLRPGEGGVEGFSYFCCVMQAMDFKAKQNSIEELRWR